MIDWTAATTVTVNAGTSRKCEFVERAATLEVEMALIFKVWVNGLFAEPSYISFDEATGVGLVCSMRLNEPVEPHVPNIPPAALSAVIQAAAPSPRTVPANKSPFETQVGGTHYTDLKIQPFEYSMANGLDPMQHTIIKYVTRFRGKNGLKDLEKAKHTIDLLIEVERRRAA
jgi:hypothetical protein